MAPILDRLVPADFSHVEKYPLTSETAPTDPVPVVAGTNWYDFMDRPVYDPTDRRYWIGRGLSNERWGTVRGGHAYCLKPDAIRDLIAWWAFYNQGNQGACVGFAASRSMTLLDRKRLDAFALYYKAQKIDEWPGENYSGTSVRAAMDVLRTEGAQVIARGKTSEPKPEHGIEANRWALTMEDVYSVLKSPRLEKQGVLAILNSWGKNGYPHIVYIEAEKMDRLRREYGELTMMTPK